MSEMTVKKEMKRAMGKDGSMHDVQWFEVSGRVNTTTAEQLDREMTKALKSGSYITLNMYNVTLLTSVGIRVILKTFKQCTAAEGKFLLERPSQMVENVLGLSALEQLLN